MRSTTLEKSALSVLAAAAALAAAVLLLQPVAAQASDVYCKTVDRRLQCRDTPFEGAVLVRRSGQSQIVGENLQPAPATPPAPASSVAAVNASVSERLQQAATSRAVQADVAATQAKQCKEATDRYNRAIEARRIYKTGPNGEQIFLNEAELTQARVEARNARDLACGTRP
ncbi:MAG: hypothetical protein R3E65_03250 [Steroidobacteraceae bacterium]